MADLTISVTDRQIKALRRLDPALSARQVVQVHVDTWLAPLLADLSEDDRREVTQAYVAASPSVQTSVRGLLGLG